MGNKSSTDKASTLGPQPPVRTLPSIRAELFSQRPKQLLRYDNPAPITQTIGSIRAPESYIDFKTCSSLYRRFEPEKYNIFLKRLNENTEKFQKEKEDEAQRLRLERIRVDSSSYTSRSPEKVYPSINSILDLTTRVENLKSLSLKYFSPKPERPELDESAKRLIRDVLRPHPPDEVLTEIDGAPVLRKDFQTLAGLNWLNDEIINAYMHLLVLRGRKSNFKKTYAFSTFFYPKLRDSGFSSIKRWTRKVDLFSFDFLLVPVHLGTHWCLALIDFPLRTVSYYDSLGGSPRGCCDTLLSYLKQESNDKRKQDFDYENWKTIDCSLSGIPQQQNYSDCGVFVCVYAEHLTRQAKLNFGQKDMPYFRNKIIYELIKREIMDT